MHLLTKSETKKLEKSEHPEENETESKKKRESKKKKSRKKIKRLKEKEKRTKAKQKEKDPARSLRKSELEINAYIDRFRLESDEDESDKSNEKIEELTELEQKTKAKKKLLTSLEIKAYIDRFRLENDEDEAEEHIEDMHLFDEVDNGNNDIFQSLRGSLNKIAPKMKSTDKSMKQNIKQKDNELMEPIKEIAFLREQVALLHAEASAIKMNEKSQRDRQEEEMEALEQKLEKSETANALQMNKEEEIKIKKNAMELLLEQHEVERKAMKQEMERMLANQVELRQQIEEMKKEKDKERTCKSQQSPASPAPSRPNEAVSDSKVVIKLSPNEAITLQAVFAERDEFKKQIERFRIQMDQHLNSQNETKYEQSKLMSWIQQQQIIKNNEQRQSPGNGGLTALQLRSCASFIFET